MDEKALKSMATILAAHAPSHLGKATTPPVSWSQNGEVVSVILADGRKVSASIQEINALMFAAKSAASGSVDGNAVDETSHARTAGGEEISTGVQKPIPRSGMAAPHNQTHKETKPCVTKLESFSN